MSERVQIGANSVGSRANVAGRLRKTRFRLGAVLALVIAAGVVVWLLTTRGDSSFSMSPVTPIAPSALSVSGLTTVAGQIDHPVYWAGSKTGYTYELRRDRDDSIFIRYLPSGTAVGTKGRFLIIATYRLRDAYAAIQHAARTGPNKVTVNLRNGGLAVYSRLRPTAYYFAYPDSHYQVGVFAPTAAEARSLVLKGLVVPIL